MSERHWLSRACSDAGTYSLRLLWTKRIIAYQGWSLATNSKSLLAIADGGALAEPGDDPPPTDQQAKWAAEYLGAKPNGRAVVVEVNDLRKWCVWAPAKPCPRCCGSGLADHMPDNPIGDRELDECWECGGDKTADNFEERLGWVDGALVDRAELLRVLPPEIGGGVTLWASDERVGYKPKLASIVHLRGSDWRAAVCGVSDDPDSEADQKRNRYVPTYVPGIGVLWHLRDQGRGVLYDWCLDQGLDIEQIHPLPF